MPQQYNSHRTMGRLDVASAGINGLLSLEIVDMHGTGCVAKDVSDFGRLAIQTWQKPRWPHRFPPRYDRLWYWEYSTAISSTG
jgi:hypothetical protein